MAAILPLTLAAAEATSELPKTHALFLGADLLIEYENKQYRIEDVSGSQFKIMVDGREVLVRTRNRSFRLGVKQEMKLSGSAVKLDNLKSGPAYSPGSDPMKALSNSAGLASSAGAQQDLALAQMSRDLDNVSRIESSLANPMPEEARQQQMEALGRTRADLENSQRQAQSVGSSIAGDLTNVGAGAHRMAVAEGSYDAMELSFKISSAVELRSPYLVALFRFQAPGAAPGSTGLVIHAQALDPINSRPGYVRVLKPGLPVGFKFVDCTVHIYDRGREVATNFSDKRTELTHDEAQSYFVKAYLEANKSATAAAAGVPGSLPPVERKRLNHGQLTRALHVKVSKDGTMLGVFTDADCNQALGDGAVVAAAGELFYKPALSQGEPVEGVARLRLADF